MHPLTTVFIFGGSGRIASVPALRGCPFHQLDAKAFDRLISAKHPGGIPEHEVLLLYCLGFDTAFGLMELIHRKGALRMPTLVICREKQGSREIQALHDLGASAALSLDGDDVEALTEAVRVLLPSLFEFHTEPESVAIGPLTFSRDRWSLSEGERILPLHKHSLELFEYLSRARNRNGVTREALMRDVTERHRLWRLDRQLTHAEGTLDRRITMLRKELGPHRNCIEKPPGREIVRFAAAA